VNAAQSRPLEAPPDRAGAGQGALSAVVPAPPRTAVRPVPVGRFSSHLAGQVRRSPVEPIRDVGADLCSHFQRGAPTSG
jgi:hypothetical protein